MHQTLETRPKDLDHIQLETVVVSQFSQSGLLEQRVRGKTATVGKKFETMVLTPSTIEIFEKNQPQATIRSEKGSKTFDDKGVERFELEGRVFGENQLSQTIESELLYYYPKRQEVLSPEAATLTTTDTSLRADALEGRIDLQAGTARGKVVLRFLGRDSEGRPSPPLVIRGDVARFRFQERVHHVEGNVLASQGSLELRCQSLRFRQDANQLFAERQVEAKDADTQMWGESLEADLTRRVYVIRGNPRVLEEGAEPGTRQDLRARVLTVNRPAQTLEGEDDVRFETLRKQGTRFVRESLVRSKAVLAQQARGKVNFTDDVRLTSGPHEGKGKNAIYYQKNGNIHLNGGQDGWAELWEKDAQGKVIHQVKGRHVVHNQSKGKSFVVHVQGTARDL